MNVDTSSGQKSFLIEILDWALLPLLAVWTFSVAVTYFATQNVANKPYDKELSDNLDTLSRLIRVESHQIVANLPADPGAFLHTDERDTTYYQVRGPRNEFVAGDRDMPSVKRTGALAPGVVHYRDDHIRGEEIRVAYLLLVMADPPGSHTVLLQVAETFSKRSELANEIFTSIILPQFLIIPLALILVWLGLNRGVKSLTRLQKTLRERRPTDLSPIDETHVPDELGPLIRSINDLMARLNTNLRAQQRFIADAAHQMKTPLVGLKTQTELALRQSNPDELRQSLHQIDIGAERASHLIKQLLALARVEASLESRPEFAALDLEQILRRAVEAAVPNALAKHIDLGFEGVGWPTRIMGNELLLCQLMGNLLDNAIRYTPAGGKVTARIRAAEFAVLEVEDSGIGIDPKDRDLVFERFYRVLGTEADGSGLGLAIVREIAGLHGANVLLNAGADGHGTLVSVSFPRYRPNS